MSVHLVGGGRDLEAAAAVYGGFVAQARARAASSGRLVPLVAVVVVAEIEELDGAVGWFAQALQRCGEVEVTPVTTTSEGTLARPGGAAPTDAWWSGLDGLLVGGGLTPAYHRVLLPHAGAIRDAVSGGVPYAGFSAGAMIAPRRALLGGWRLGSAAVTHEDNAEDLDQVCVVDGLGLTTGIVDAHAAQWGTLSRLLALVGAGQSDAGIAVDENTVVILDPATDDAAITGAPIPVAVAGAGQAWFLTPENGSVRVDRREAGRFASVRAR